MEDGINGDGGQNFLLRKKCKEGVYLLKSYGKQTWLENSQFMFTEFFGNRYVIILHFFFQMEGRNKKQERWKCILYLVSCD